MSLPGKADGEDPGRGVAGLVEEVTALRTEVAALEAGNAALREEIARLKGLPGRPKVGPSGMERATTPRGERPQGRTKKGAARATTGLVVHEEEHVLTIAAPPGSRFKGYEDAVIHDPRLEPRVIRYRRQRWLTPDGRTPLAPLPAGVVGRFGPELRRVVPLQHHHRGRVTAERITAFPSGLGLAISKRRVVRLPTAGSAALVAEAAAVPRAGLATARWITVGDTGARHRARNGVTTQIGDDRFTFFATGAAKSRRNVLEVLRAGREDHAINDDALAHPRAHGLAGSVIDRPAAHPTRRSADRASWRAHLEALGLTRLGVMPDAVKLATGGALRGSIRGHGLPEGTVIVSDDAGQFRVGRHASGRVHAERLVHRLVPFNERRRRAVELVRQPIRWFDADLKAHKGDPCRKRAGQLRARFDRIFRRRTGSVTLDRLPARLHARRAELRLVLERPEIPLHTNGSGNDLRAHVTGREISGGTRSEAGREARDAGREARDAGLALMKTCRRLGISSVDYLGDRLGVPGAPLVPPSPDLIRTRASP